MEGDVGALGPVRGEGVKGLVRLPQGQGVFVLLHSGLRGRASSRGGGRRRSAQKHIVFEKRLRGQFVGSRLNGIGVPAPRRGRQAQRDQGLGFGRIAELGFLWVGGRTLSPAPSQAFLGGFAPNPGLRHGSNVVLFRRRKYSFLILFQVFSEMAKFENVSKFRETLLRQHVSLFYFCVGYLIGNRKAEPRTSLEYRYHF